MAVLFGMLKVSRLKFQWNWATTPGDSIFRKSVFNVIDKGKPPRMFSLSYSLLKMDTYSNGFQKIFQLKNPVIATRSDQIR